MVFLYFCTGLVITVVIMFVTALLGFASHTSDGDFELVWISAWLVSSFGFGVCLTILFVQGGIFK